jgi:hypothetical protein
MLREFKDIHPQENSEKEASIDIPINGTLEYKSSYVFIRNIAIKLNTRLFEKHSWDFVFII